MFFLYAFAGRLVFGATGAQEKEIWTLWTLHTNSPTAHAAILAECRQTQKHAPANPLLPVVQGLAAWHSLKLGLTNEAYAILGAMAAMAPTNPMAAPAVEMGQRWLTRLDREKVRGALADYYREAIKYPPNLQALAQPGSAGKTAPLPLTDRWGAPWQYQPSTFKIIKGTQGQRYLLESKTLADSSDLAKVLARPYAGRILIAPLSVTKAGGGEQHVVFQNPGNRPKTILLSEGAGAMGITLAYIGEQVLVLCDGDHWRVVVRPAR